MSTVPTTYSEWLKSPEGSQYAQSTNDKDALKATYDYRRAHPDANDTEVEDYWLAHLKDKKPSIYDQVVHPDVFPNLTHASPGPAAATKPAAGSAPPPVQGTANPDAASAVATASKGDPKLAAILNSALASGAASGTVTLWDGLGVDPDAPVFGGTKPVKPSSYRLPPGSATRMSPTTQSADKWLKGLYTMSPQDLADLQHRLYDQGWYSGTKAVTPAMIQYGRPDAATLQAYGSVLAEGARYNAAGKHISINQVIDLGGTMDKAGGTGQPFEATNPADLESALRTESQQEIGRDPNAGDLSGYSDSYLGQEDAARRALVAAGTANATVGITGPPSPTAGADAYIESHNLADKVAYGAAVRQQAFFSMLKDPTA